MANTRIRNAIKDALGEFIASFQLDEYKQYPIWDEFSGGRHDGLNMEFKFGDYHFIVRGEVCTSVRTGMLKTYEVVPNPMSYPNKMERHSPDMDIVVLPTTNMRFVKEMIGTVNIMGNDMEHDFSEIRDFARSYGSTLSNNIAERERIEYGPILERMGIAYR